MDALLLLCYTNNEHRDQVLLPTIFTCLYIFCLFFACVCCLFTETVFIIPKRELFSRKQKQ